MLTDLLNLLIDKERMAREQAEARREELREALRRRQVGDPVTMTLLGVTFWHFAAGVGISLGLSIGTGLLMGALQKRQTVRQGDRGGQELSVQRSALGTPIAEIYGGDPGDGLGGGVKIAPIVAWLSKTEDGYTARKHLQKTSSNAGKGRPKAPDVETITYDLDALLMWGRGPLVMKKLWAAVRLIYRAASSGSSNTYQAEDAGNTLAGGATVVSDGDASGGSAVDVPPTGSVRWNSLSGDGSGITLQFYYKSSAECAVEFTFAGEAGVSVFNDHLNSTNGEYALGYYSAPFRFKADASNYVKVKNTSGGVTVRFDRLVVQFPGDPIGVPNPTVPTDSPYLPLTPPDPIPDYDVPQARLMGALDIDPDTRATVGTIAAGNFAAIANYEGNGTEQPDPIIQAEVDGRLGAGSTPAYRHAATTRLANFYLTEYQETFPPFWGLLEHKTIRNFGTLCEHLSERAGLLPDEYDYTDLYDIALRGVAVAPPYTPRELMTTLARVYNCYFFEADKIYGLKMESAPEFNLTDDDLGWVDEPPDTDAIAFPELKSELPPETDIPRRITLRYISPARNYDQNSANEPRMVTTGRREDTLDIAVTLTDEESREATARELYQEDVESVTHEFSLSYEHLWRDPGSIAVITRNEGLTERVRLTSIKPTLGALECTGESIDTAIFTQPAVGPGITYEELPVPAAAMTILGFYDNGALRTADIGRVGWYAYGVPRTGPGVWPSSVLYREDGAGLPERMATLPIPATVGRILTKLGSVVDTTVEDGARTVTFNATTDRLNLTAHNLSAGETVMLANSGGALPPELSATTLYYVINPTANDFQISLTAGGSVVAFSTNGTGTSTVSRVIDVDLYGTKATLETITTTQRDRGEGAVLTGDEVLIVRTWEQVTGFPNRWRGRNFTRALLNTDIDMATHVQNERFLLLDSAVQFVEMDVVALNELDTWHAVTAGQSYDDSAGIDQAWTGGALKYPPPSIQGTKDADGTWRFLLFGYPVTDPAGERYQLEIDGGRTFTLHGHASRPASLSSTSALPGDSPLPPGKGSSQYRAATRPGNSITNTGAFMIQFIEAEGTSVSATFRTTLDADSSPVTPTSIIEFSNGALYGLTLTIRAQTSTTTAQLTISDNIDGVVFTDTDGEATDTRYTVEFRDGKILFYRDRHLQSNPFYTYTIPEIPGLGADEFFPLEAHFSAGTDATLADIEIDDNWGAVVYKVDEQEADFGSAQTTLTVRGCQQRVIDGRIVNGRITEATFP